MSDATDTVRLSDLRPGDELFMPTSPNASEWVRVDEWILNRFRIYGTESVPRSSVRFKESQGLPTGTRTNQEDATS